MDASSHTARITDLVTRLHDTTSRFQARLERAGGRAEQATTGWSPAQIAVHVALVNESLASVIDGSAAGAAPAAEGFLERPWAEVVGQVPARNEAPARFHPPPTVGAAEAIQQFHASAQHLARAIETLPPDRAGYCITNRAVGTISLYQAGEFAIAHMIRHNQQAKRILDA